MSGGDLPPDWAIDKALKLMEYGGTPLAKVKGDPNEHYEVIAFARYIAKHEEPPVDPLEDEIQQIADGQGLNLSVMPRVETALYLAIRRGIELSKEDRAS